MWVDAAALFAEREPRIAEQEEEEWGEEESKAVVRFVTASQTRMETTTAPTAQHENVSREGEQLLAIIFLCC